MKIILWIVCILACLLSGVVLFYTIIDSEGAPQQAAGAAISCALVIIPYVLARAFEKLLSKEK